MLLFVVVVFIVVVVEAAMATATVVVAAVWIPLFGLLFFDLVPLTVDHTGQRHAVWCRHRPCIVCRGRISPIESLD